MKCDHVFIVAKISRAITDQSLKSSLYTVLTRHVPLEWEESAGKNLKLAVICTKSEVYDFTSLSQKNTWLNHDRISTREPPDESFAGRIRELHDL